MRVTVYGHDEHGHPIREVLDIPTAGAVRSEHRYARLGSPHEPVCACGHPHVAHDFWGGGPCAACTECQWFRDADRDAA